MSLGRKAHLEDRPLVEGRGPEEGKHRSREAEGRSPGDLGGGTLLVESQVVAVPAVPLLELRPKLSKQEERAYNLVVEAGASAVIRRRRAIACHRTQLTVSDPPTSRWSESQTGNLGGEIEHEEHKQGEHWERTHQG